MKSWNLTFTILVASMLLGGLALGVHAQRSPSKRKNFQATEIDEPQVFTKEVLAPAFPINADQLAAKRLEAQEEPPWSVRVDWTLRLDPQTMEIYEQAASAVRAFGAIPDARFHQFSAVQNPPKIAIKGWSGMVRSMEPADGGYIVTVDVIPILTSAIGNVSTISSNYSERYFIDLDNNVHYLDSLDPQGMAGQEPLFYTSG